MTDVDARTKREATTVVLTELVADPSNDDTIHRRLDTGGGIDLIVVRNVQLSNELRVSDDGLSAEEDRRLHQIRVAEQIDGRGDVASQRRARAERVEGCRRAPISHAAAKR